jgi:hypothetical protein
MSKGRASAAVSVEFARKLGATGSEVNASAELSALYHITSKEAEKWPARARAAHSAVIISSIKDSGRRLH